MAVRFLPTVTMERSRYRMQEAVNRVKQNLAFKFILDGVKEWDVIPLKDEELVCSWAKES